MAKDLPGLDRFKQALSAVAGVSQAKVESKIAAQKKARAKLKKRKKK